MRISDWSSDVCSSDLGNNNIAESIVGQLQHERYPEPAWIVCGAGTGGTSATIGRYLRYRGLRTRLCVAEPTGMAFARRSEEHTSELQSLMRISYAVFCLKNKTPKTKALQQHRNKK